MGKYAIRISANDSVNRENRLFRTSPICDDKHLEWTRGSKCIFRMQIELGRTKLHE